MRVCFYLDSSVWRYMISKHKHHETQAISWTRVLMLCALAYDINIPPKLATSLGVLNISHLPWDPVQIHHSPLRPTFSSTKCMNGFQDVDLKFRQISQTLSRSGPTFLSSNDPRNHVQWRVGESNTRERCQGASTNWISLEIWATCSSIWKFKTPKPISKGDREKRMRGEWVGGLIILLIEGWKRWVVGKISGKPYLKTLWRWIGDNLTFRWFANWQRASPYSPDQKIPLFQQEHIDVICPYIGKQGRVTWIDRAKLLKKVQFVFW